VCTSSAGEAWSSTWKAGATTDLTTAPVSWSYADTVMSPVEVT
jgi:hypothetical protein